ILRRPLSCAPCEKPLCGPGNTPNQTPNCNNFICKPARWHQAHTIARATPSELTCHTATPINKEQSRSSPYYIYTSPLSYRILASSYPWLKHYLFRRHKERRSGPIRIGAMRSAQTEAVVTSLRLAASEVAR